MRGCFLPFQILVRSLTLETCLLMDGAVDDDAVFGLVYSDLIVLKAEVSELLHDSHDVN